MYRLLLGADGTGKALTNHFAMVSSWMFEFLSRVADQIRIWILKVMVEAVARFFALLPESVSGWLGTNPITAVISYFDFADRLFPVYTSIGIMMATLGLVAGIRLVRWILSCVPTVALGS